MAKGQESQLLKGHRFRVVVHVNDGAQVPIKNVHMAAAHPDNVFVITRAIRSDPDQPSIWEIFSGWMVVRVDVEFLHENETVDRRLKIEFSTISRIPLIADANSSIALEGVALHRCRYSWSLR